MPDKPPAFVVHDRRKFTAEGEVREGYTPPEETQEQARSGAESEVQANPQPANAAPAEPPPTGAKVVTMPNRSTLQADDFNTANAGYDVDGDGLSSDDEADEASDLAELGPPPSAAETAAQHSAYQRSTRELDAMLQQANPGMQAPGAVGFEHIVQSFYLSAIMAMGAGTEANQKPRIDILGARQAIDMLNVLEEKTRGNLNDKEQRLLQGVSFELRMMFLELTNAIAAQAQQAPPPGRK